MLASRLPVPTELALPDAVEIKHLMDSRDNLHEASELLPKLQQDVPDPTVEYIYIYIYIYMQNH